MSKYLSSSYSPVVFESSVMDIAHAVEQLVDINRTIPIPRVGSSFIYNRTLYSKLLSLVTSLSGQTINSRPAVLADTEITKSLVGSLIEKHGLQWGLVYSKEDRKTNGKDSTEVSLANIKRFVSDLVLENITLKIDYLGDYLEFVEAETQFLDAVEKSLAPEVGNLPQKGSSTIVTKPVDKSELERFRGIAEKMKLLQSKKSKEVDPNDLW